MLTTSLSQPHPDTYRSEPSAAEMRKETQAFAKKLRDNPQLAKQFFQRAGILNSQGKLKTPYK